MVTLVGANTNPAEMHVMKNEIIKLTRMVNENITSSKIGEFENHTKDFGSSYMMKYGFVKGKGIDKNAQGEKDPIPFTKNNNYADIGKNEAKVEGMASTYAKVMVSNPCITTIGKITIKSKRTRPTFLPQVVPSNMLLKVHSMPIMC